MNMLPSINHTINVCQHRTIALGSNEWAQCYYSKHGVAAIDRFATIVTHSDESSACSRALETHRIRYAPRRIEHKLRGKLLLDPADLLYRAGRRPRTADQQQTRSGGVAMWRQARGARGAGAYSPPMEG